MKNHETVFHVINCHVAVCHAVVPSRKCSLWLFHHVIVISYKRSITSTEVAPRLTEKYPFFDDFPNIDKNIFRKVVFSDPSNASASGGGDLGEAVRVSWQQRVDHQIYLCLLLWNVFLILHLCILLRKKVVNPFRGEGNSFKASTVGHTSGKWFSLTFVLCLIWPFIIWGPGMVAD